MQPKSSPHRQSQPSHTCMMHAVESRSPKRAVYRLLFCYIVNKKTMNHSQHLRRPSSVASFLGPLKRPVYRFVVGSVSLQYRCPLPASPPPPPPPPLAHTAKAGKTWKLKDAIIAKKRISNYLNSQSHNVRNRQVESQTRASESFRSATFAHHRRRIRDAQYARLIHRGPSETHPSSISPAA